MDDRVRSIGSGIRSAVFTSIVALQSIIFCAVVAGVFAKYNAVCELLCHFQICFTLASIVFGVTILLISRHWSLLVIASCIISLVCTLQVGKMYLPSPGAKLVLSQETLRLAQLNVWGGKNRNYKRAVEAVRQNDPDIICLSEITTGWLAQMQKSLPDYPYVVADPHYGGIGIFSKLPLRDKRIYYYGPIKRPRAYAKVMIGDREVSLIFVHTVTPFKSLALRDGEFAEIARQAAEQRCPTIVAGDINCGPWSYYFRKMLTDGRLADTEQGFGPQPSWNAHYHLVPVLPIDHCLVSSQWRTLDRRVGDECGSDHLPVLVELALVPTVGVVAPAP